MFPSLAYHGFYNTQGNNSLIVSSSCEKKCCKREQANERLFYFGTKHFRGQLLTVSSINEHSHLFGKHNLAFPINY